MTASTAPTQPPDKCPACGAKVTSVSADGFREFACGKMQRISDGVYGSMCHNAEAAAIALRAELAEEKELAKKDAEKLRTFLYKMWCALRGVPEGTQREGDDLIELAASLRAERDAALAQVESWRKRIEAHMDYIEPKIDRTKENVAALTARLAELQAVVDAAVEWSVRASDLDTIWTQYNREKYDKAEKELLAALAALASGAESEMTK